MKPGLQLLVSAIVANVRFIHFVMGVKASVPDEVILTEVADSLSVIGTIGFHRGHEEEAMKLVTLWSLGVAEATEKKAKAPPVVGSA
jgi:hypothetical protein